MSERGSALTSLGSRPAEVRVEKGTTEITLQTLSGTDSVGFATPAKRLMTCERGNRAKEPVCCAHPHVGWRLHRAHGRKTPRSDARALRVTHREERRGDSGRRHRPWPGTPPTPLAPRRAPRAPSTHAGPISPALS
eukprot:7837331-Pyramimonas_sp.AAC.1